MSSTEHTDMKPPYTISFGKSTTAWLVLMTLSTISFVLGSLKFDQSLMATVLMLTLIKGQLVVRDFMGLRHVRPLWRHIMTSYLLTVGGLIAIAYLTA